MKDYTVDQDLYTMVSAHQIEKDPKRLKAVQARAKEKIAEMQAMMDEEKPDKE